MAYQEVVLEGVVTLTPEGGTEFDAGSVNELTLSFEDDEFNVPNKRGGGGINNAFSRPKSMKVAMKTSTHSKDNLAMALRGESSTLAGITTIQALVNSGKTYSMHFEGVNAADGDKQFNLTVFKMKPKTSKGLGFISNGFNELEIEFEVLADNTRVGAGTSKFFILEIAD